MIRKGFLEKNFRHLGVMMELSLIHIKKQAYVEEMTVI
jgi:hypothetical protein